ncbi:MAG: IS110 family transposase [Erysipelotrichaceae bacterium]|nr:IS110 family transposase [Erysipelotrichaceae bacterium]
MIDKETPVLAFDVSKGSSHCQAFYSFGKPSGRPIRVAHCKSGMAAAEGISEALEEKTGRRPKVVLEATGVYSRPVIRWAELNGLEVYLISPLESAKVRKSRVRPTKTDALDCGVIAEVAYTRSLRRVTPRSSLYSQLYSLSRRRAAIAGRLVASKNQYRKSLDCVWPLLDEACDPFSGYAMWAVGRYRHPEALAKAKGESIVSGLERAKVRTGGISKAAAASKLSAYAKDAVSGCPADGGEVDSLLSALDDVIRDMRALDEITGRLLGLAKGLPHFALIASIDGTGDALAALLCAEIGDPSRFASRNGIVAYAGLDPTILQSGRNDGLHYSITRKGNAFLRKYLYLAVENMVMSKADNAITRFYSKKKSSGLCHKAAATAACRKLLVCIWGMLRSGSCFER